MSKAAQHQTIKKEDFLKAKPVEKHSIFHAPHLPSLHDGVDDDDDLGDDNIRPQPISIAVLKELMQKKIQAKANQTTGRKNRNGHLGSMQFGMGISTSTAGLRSRQSSNVSLRSDNSDRSLHSQKSSSMTRNAERVTSSKVIS